MTNATTVHSKDDQFMIVVGYRRFNDSEITVACGAWYSNEVVLCDDCEKVYHEIYPQGWQSYPGDVCRHGTYVGGCGVDWMCGPCEMGED